MTVLPPALFVHRCCLHNVQETKSSRLDEPVSQKREIGSITKQTQLVNVKVARQPHWCDFITAITRELGALGYPHTLYAQKKLVIQKKLQKFQIFFRIKHDQVL